MDDGNFGSQRNRRPISERRHAPAADVAHFQARLERLIERADAVELRLAAKEWSVRQHCLHLEEYLHGATEIQHALAEFSDLLKKLEPAKGERA